MIIYKVTNKINGKIYIGQTVQKLSDRWSDHSRPGKGKHPNRSCIASAIRKYGKENFTLEQIDTAGSIEGLNILEIHYITKFNSLAPNGYNMELGGDSKHCHPDTRAKISRTLKGRPIKNRMNGAPKGRPVYDERRAQISATMTGVAQPWKYKQVMVVETGVIYESVQDAANKTGIARPTVSTLLKSGKQHKKSGFTFKFISS